MDRQLLVGLPERALELIGPQHEAALAGADVEEQCLDEGRIVAEEQLLEPLVQLAAVETAGDDTCDERRCTGSGEKDEHVATDEREQRGHRRLVVEQLRALTLTASEELVYYRCSGSAMSPSPFKEVQQSKRSEQ
jgi:hypothetical protein